MGNEGVVLLRKQDGWLVDDNGTVYAPKSMLDEYATRLSVTEIRLAEVERERDTERAGRYEATNKLRYVKEQLEVVRCQRNEHIDEAFAFMHERDDARRVAKSLAVWSGAMQPGSRSADVRTALAYEVD